jgi:hypothetical protein
MTGCIGNGLGKTNPRLIAINHGGGALIVMRVMIYYPLPLYNRGALVETDLQSRRRVLRCNDSHRVVFELVPGVLQLWIALYDIHRRVIITCWLVIMAGKSPYAVGQPDAVQYLKAMTCGVLRSGRFFRARLGRNEGLIMILKPSPTARSGIGRQRFGDIRTGWVLGGSH